MRQNHRVHFIEQRKKEVARRHYALRQIETYIEWTMRIRGYLKWKDLKRMYNKYNLEF
jgi:hypothetical protein